MKRSISRHVLLGVAIALLLAPAGCKKEETKTETPPVATEPTPTLPSTESMAVDFSAFGGSSTLSASALGTGAGPPGTERSGAGRDGAGIAAFPLLGSYYNDAAFTVGVWNALIVLGFAAPAYLFAQAVNTAPIYQGNLTWLWGYSTQLGLNLWTASLTATLDATTREVTWSMKLTNGFKDVNGCCTDFKWFSGVQTVATSGYWQFYDPKTPTAAAPVIRVDWAVNSATDRKLTFTNNSATAATTNWGNGSYLDYLLNGTSLSLTIKNSADADTTVIAVDTTTKAGSIRYNDGATLGCWDGSHANTACP
jgi:hypothetical protein